MAKETAGGGGAAAFSTGGGKTPSAKPQTGKTGKTEKTGGVRTVAKYSSGGSGFADTALLAAEVGGVAAVTSYATARYRSTFTLGEKADGTGGVDARWPIGLALAAGGMYLKRGTAKKHIDRIAGGVLLSWLTERASAMGEDAAIKGAAAKSTEAIATVETPGLVGIGEIDPETGAINARQQRRLGRIDKRLDRLRQNREKIYNRAGIDTPVGGRQPGLRPAGFRAAAAARPRAIGQDLVTVPAWAVRPGFAMSRGMEDESGAVDD